MASTPPRPPLGLIPGKSRAVPPSSCIRACAAGWGRLNVSVFLVVCLKCYASSSWPTISLAYHHHRRAAAPPPLYPNQPGSSVPPPHWVVLQKRKPHVLGPHAAPSPSFTHSHTRARALHTARLVCLALPALLSHLTPPLIYPLIHLSIVSITSKHFFLNVLPPSLLPPCTLPPSLPPPLPGLACFLPYRLRGKK